VIDNTDEGYSFNATAQLRGSLGGVGTIVGYSYTQAKNNLKSTEIASVLWQNQPVQGDPNNPELSWSEFGQQHRLIGSATYDKSWSTTLRTQVGLVFEMSQGNRFGGAGGNRYSFIYSGDVNGDGSGGNDLIYIPRDQNDINLEAYTDNAGRVHSVQEQRDQLHAFIEQDKYLRDHRGQIAERFGALNPWYSNVDFRVLQDFAVPTAGTRHAFQLTLDLLNVGNFINSDWGVRKVASPAATSPLRLATDPTTGAPKFTATGAPILNFTGPSKTFIDDPGLFSRWRAQVGLRYFFN
jgi:hypothetical protein